MAAAAAREGGSAAAAAKGRPPLRPPSPSLAATLQFAWLFLPVLLHHVYGRLDPAHRGVAFLVAAVLTVRFVARRQVAATANADAPLRVTEWGQAGLKSRVQVRFPVEVRRIKRYIEVKQREQQQQQQGEGGGRNNAAVITVLHVCMRALGRALEQIPEVRACVGVGVMCAVPRRLHLLLCFG